MTKKVTLDVVTRLQDNQDGGYAMCVYNNDDELIADHPRSWEWDSEQKKDVPRELTANERKAILGEKNPYATGYIGIGTVELEVGDDGSIRLAKPMHLYVGQ